MMRGKSPRSKEVPNRISLPRSDVEMSKTHFLPFMYIFQRAVTHSKIVRLTRFFFYRFRPFQLRFFVLWVLSLSKNHEAKMSKNWILWRLSIGPGNPWAAARCHSCVWYLLVYCPSISPIHRRKSLIGR